MSQKRKDRNKHSGDTGTQGASGKKKFFRTIFVVALVAFITWGLIHLSTPESHLEPYTKFKKPPLPVEKSSIETPDSPDQKTRTPEPLIDPAQEVHDQIAQVSDTPAPSPSGLPRETLEHISKGMELTEKGKFNAAEIEFEKAGELSPDSPMVFAIWGTSLRLQKKYQGANRRFGRAMELAPNDEEIAYNWGVSRLLEKNADEAIKLFKKTIKLDPNHYMAYNHLGKSYGLKKNYVLETESYKKALKIKPDFALTHFNLGITLSIQKKLDEATPHFEKAIELDKQFEKPFVMQFLAAMGRLNKPKGPELTPTQSAKKDSEDQTAKLDTGKSPAEETKKSEGSDHKMEGSKAKIVKETTLVKGKVTVNGQPLDSAGLVFLETKTKMKPSTQKAQHLTISQRSLQFAPKHTVVMVGSKISFTNEDVEVHNIYSKSMNNQFNLGAMAAGSTKEITLTTPGPIVLRCNMHKDMIGTLFVVPNGYYSRLNNNGEYQFDSVKSNEYIMQAWHPGLYPEDIEKNSKSVSLTGVDAVQNFDFTSKFVKGEIHDMVDATDYNLVVDNIEKELFGAIESWKLGRKFTPRKRMLMAITKFYAGGGLKGAIAKSFSEKRSLKLEKEMDDIRKKISGLDTSEKITEASLKFKAERVVAQLRNNVQELEARLNPPDK